MIAKSWVDPDLVDNRGAQRDGYDIASIYVQLARGHERGRHGPGRAASPKFAIRRRSGQTVGSGERRFRATRFCHRRSVAFEQNERLLEQWHTLPRRVQDEVWTHLRHYLIRPGRLMAGRFDARCLGVFEHFVEEPTHVTFPTAPAGLPGLESPISGSVAKLLDRLKTAIADWVTRRSSKTYIPHLIGGEDSLLGSEDVMVVPGHLADTSRPILLAATKGWSGKEPQSFAKVMRQVKAHLVESREAIHAVVVFCDCWDSAFFGREHREELRAHDQNGVRFLFLLVGVPDKTLVSLPVELG